MKRPQNTFAALLTAAVLLLPSSLAAALLEVIPGDSIIITIEVRRRDPFGASAGVLYSPTGGATVTVEHSESGTKEVDATAMTEYDTGKFYYIWQSATDDATGEYNIEINATDAGGNLRAIEGLIKLVETTE